MSSLHELQCRFAEAVLGEDTGRLEAHIVAGSMSASDRLSIYRESVFGILTSALASVYPVVQQLVGEEFFRSACRVYVRRYPSISGDLHEFGGAFPTFLGEFPPAAELAYLPDVARLEWCVHRVFHAAAHPPLSVERLATVSPSNYEALRFEVHPACRLLSSDFPVHRIWQVNQADYRGDQRVDLAQGGCRLLICRGTDGIEVHPLTPGEFALLEALAADTPLATAAALANEVEPEFELGVHLQHHIAGSTLVDFRVCSVDGKL